MEPGHGLLEGEPGLRALLRGADLARFGPRSSRGCPSTLRRTSWCTPTGSTSRSGGDGRA